MAQLPLDWTLPTSYDAADFVVTESNKLAHSQITNQAPSDSNALLLTGPESSGKSHLAHIWAALNDARFVAASALANQTSEHWFGENNAIVIEEIERCNADALFHMLQYLAQHQNNKAMLTSSLAIADLWLEPRDIHSRLHALPNATLYAPDDALLEAIMRKGFSDRQLRVDANVIQYLIPRISRDFASLYQLLGAIDKAALEQKRPITLPLARSVLEKLENNQ